MKISFMKREGALYPVTEWDKEKFKGIPNGLQTVLDVKKKRNVRLFRKYWALCRMIYHNTDNFRDVHHVSDCLLIATGYYDTMTMLSGDFYVKPHSIAWESCSSEKFEEIWEKVLPLAEKALGVSREEIDDNLVFEM